MREMLAKSLAVDQFSRNVVLAVHLANFINGQNVRMIERGRSLGFPDEPVEFVFILAEFFIEEFDRYFPIELSVLR